MLWKRAATGSFLALLFPAFWDQRMVFYKARGLLAWWKAFGHWWRYAGGGCRKALLEWFPPEGQGSSGRFGVSPCPEKTSLPSVQNPSLSENAKESCFHEKGGMVTRDEGPYPAWGGEQGAIEVAHPPLGLRTFGGILPGLVLVTG